MEDEKKTFYISDVFGEDYLSEFEKVNYVLIQSQTGAGKTTFLLNRLVVDAVHDARTVLYLVPRTILKHQIMQAVRQIGANAPSIAQLLADRFCLMTYHELASRIADGKARAVDYIVCDEAHALVCESTYVASVYQPAYDWIVSQSATKIIVSATLDPIYEFLKMDQKIKEVKKYGSESV